MSQMRRRLGITPLLSVIILIGIALVGGLFLSGISTQFLIASYSEIEYTVADMRLEKDSDGGCYLSVSLHNAGSVPIMSTTVKITIENGTRDWAHPDFNHSKTIIQPLGSFKRTVHFTDDPCDKFVSGDVYSMLINASSVDSSFATTMLVKVKDVGAS